MLQGMPDDQLDALVGSNQLSQNTANNIKAQRAGDTLRAEQAAADEQARAERVAAIPDERVQANMNAIEDVALQGTGVAPQYAPIIAPPPQAPSLNPTPAAPIVAAPAAAPAPVVQPPAPTPEVQTAANQQAEQQVAVQNAQAKVGEQAATNEQVKAEQAVADVAAKSAEDSAKVKADLNSDSNWGDSLKQAVAIMMGAYSQGLTGAKTNPVLDLIERRIERKAKEHQWTQEQKLKAIDDTRQDLKLQLDIAKQKNDSVTAKQNYDKGILELEKLGLQIQDADQKLSDANFLKKMRTNKTWTEADRMQIPDTQEGQEIRERLVTIGKDKNGQIIAAPAYSKAAASNLTKDVLPAISKSQESLKELLALTDYFGNNPLKKTFDRTAVAKAEGLQQMLVGNLRLEFFGPGVLTDSERAVAVNIIRDPSKLTTLASANKAALNNILEKLSISRNTQLRQSGIDVPKTTNEINIDNVKAKNPKLETHQIIKKLQESKQWVYGE